jgi:DNA-binding LacI/PurR family transcriptional regulator
MDDVARRVGVSRQLVSLVFRDQAGPSADTRDKVLRAAEELGYQPDAAAQMLRRRQSAHVSVLYTTGSPFEQDFVRDLYPAAEEVGLVLVLGALVPTRGEQETVEEMLGYRAGAFILFGNNLSDGALRRVTRHVPVVEIGKASAASGTDQVDTPGDRGIELAVDHLVELGHREITFIGGPDLRGAVRRRSGYVRSMKRQGLGDKIDLLPGDYTEEGGWRAVRQLLSRGHLPTAIVASNDPTAAGVAVTLLRAGLRIPEDVSVTGFDDSWLSRLPYLDLTTVRQDTAKMARLALRAAAERMGGSQGPGRVITVAPELVVRSSTSPPRVSEPKRLQVRNDGVGRRSTTDA